jgi:hypothetical protein
MSELNPGLPENLIDHDPEIGEGVFAKACNVDWKKVFEIIIRFYPDQKPLNPEPIINTENINPEVLTEK